MVALSALESFDWPKVSITATHLLEYGFCPRFTYFHHFLGVREHQERRFKVQKGREVHEGKTRLNKSYLRRRIGCIERQQGLKLYANDGMYVGQVDELLTLADGSMATLDYKWSVWKGRVFATQLLQLTLYSLLVADVFQVSVDRAYLVFVRSQNKLVTQELGLEHFEGLYEAIQTIQEIRERGHFPAPTTRVRQCQDCTYRNICQKA